MADKDHPKYEENAKWYGLEEDENWNPDVFDLEKTQLAIRKMF